MKMKLVFGFWILFFISTLIGNSFPKTNTFEKREIKAKANYGSDCPALHLKTKGGVILPLASRDHNAEMPVLSIQYI